jgi:alpha-galactosidase
VELALGPGSFTLTWADAGVTLGPCRAAAIVDGTERVTTGGRWHTEAGVGFGRDGTWTRWRDNGGVVAIEIHAPDDGDTVVVRAAVTAASATTVDRVTPLRGLTDLHAYRRVVDGYDSWAYSGVRADEATTSWWDALLVAPDGRALGVQALDASRLASRTAVSKGAGGDTEIRVDCGATPPLEPVAGTWGYLVGKPPGLGLPLDAGESLTSPPIAIGARRSALALGEDLAALTASSMRARRWHGPPVHGWESWYRYGLFVSAADVLANARVLRERYADRPGFDLVQVDDGWQRTYGAWWPNERFPDDLGELVDQLRSLGCRAGLWLAPWRVQPDAPGIATDHPDWCLRDRDGAPVREPRAGAWALDSSRPDACDWLR